MQRKRIVPSAKSKMFDFFKNVFRKQGDKPYGGQDRPHASLPPPPPPMPVQARSPSASSALASTTRIRPNPIARQSSAIPTGAVAAPPAYAASNGHSNGATDYSGNGHSHTNGNGNALYVPLQGILNGLPGELKAKVRQAEVGEMTVQLPLEKVLVQLSRGQVRLTFGELRQAAPHVFSSDSGQDHVQISLPLNDILCRMNPALLARRQNQRRIEVPDDIRSPFGDQGQGLSFSPTPSRTAAPIPPRPVPPAAPVAPQRPYTPPQMPAPLPPQHMHAPAAPAPIPSPMARQPAPAPMAPITPPNSVAPNPIAPSPIAPMPNAATAGYARPATGPIPTIPASAALRNLAGISPTPAPGHTQQPAHAPGAPVAKPIDEHACLFVALGALAESWPESVRLEIAQLNLANEKVALPLDLLEHGLKRGKITVPWKTLRSWIRPAQPGGVSAHDGVTLELPIKVIFPLFMSRQKGAAGKQKVAIDETIPNLFFGFPGSETAPGPAPSGLSHPVNKPVDTNYYTRSDVPALSDTEMLAKGTPSTEFLKRCATPNEVVSRAAALDGVAGALIALPDGLMVANRVQPDLNPDTLAAFLPQIFGKVSQCTKELRMGDLNNLNFTVGNIPWKIFRVNAIYFAAFGRPHEPLPTGQLAALAAELDRKNK